MELHIEHLSVSLEQDPILKDVSLSIRDGEFISLLGASGCGKTTLLKTICGILSAQSGTIRLGGEDITSLASHKRGTVVVFQDLRLFPHMTVAENIAFALKMQGVPKAQRLSDAEYFLKLVQLDGYGSRRVSQLSGGQQQRVALARALAAKPKLLLLDEPFSALDESLRQEMRALVRSLHDELHMTTVLVTHDKEEALSLSDRVAVMAEGRLLQYGTPEEIYRRLANHAVADYFGEVVYLPVSVKNGSFSLSGSSADVAVPDGSYDLLLRPNHLLTQEPGSYALTVTAVRFCGSVTKVQFSSGDGSLWEKLYDQTCPFRVGDTLSCRLDLTDPVLFPNFNSSEDCTHE